VHPIIRSYRPADLDAVYDICVRTADGGADARGMYIDDRLMGDIFAVPYVTLEPEHAHVLDDGSGTAVGYVLGTADTASFARRYREEWLPATADRIRAGLDPCATVRGHFHQGRTYDTTGFDPLSAGTWWATDRHTPAPEAFALPALT